MVTFPKTEPQIVVAQQVINALTAEAAVYPAPLVAAALTTEIPAYTTARHSVAAVEASAARAAVVREDAPATLSDAMKRQEVERR